MAGFKKTTTAELKKSDTPKKAEQKYTPLSVSNSLSLASPGVICTWPRRDALPQLPSRSPLRAPPSGPHSDPWVSWDCGARGGSESPLCPEFWGSDFETNENTKNRLSRVWGVDSPVAESAAASNRLYHFFCFRRVGFRKHRHFPCHGIRYPLL